MLSEEKKSEKKPVPVEDRLRDLIRGAVDDIVSHVIDDAEKDRYRKAKKDVTVLVCDELAGGKIQLAKLSERCLQACLGDEKLEVGVYSAFRESIQGYLNELAEKYARLLEIIPTGGHRRDPNSVGYISSLDTAQRSSSFVVEASKPKKDKQSPVGSNFQKIEEEEEEAGALVLEVPITEAMRDRLLDLEAIGLYGFSIEDVAHRLICEGLIRLFDPGVSDV